MHRGVASFYHGGMHVLTSPLSQVYTNAISFAGRGIIYMARKALSKTEFQPSRFSLKLRLLVLGALDHEVI